MMDHSQESKRYRVQLCATCDHPGGQHIIDRGCRLCDCVGWVKGLPGWWSDRLTKKCGG